MHQRRIWVFPVAARRTGHPGYCLGELFQTQVGRAALRWHGAYTHPSMGCQDVLPLFNQRRPSFFIAVLRRRSNPISMAGCADLLVHLVPRLSCMDGYLRSAHLCAGQGGCTC